MKPKQIFILAIILAVLIVGVIIKQHHKPAELTTEEYAPLDLTFNEANVTKIEVFKGNGEKVVDLAKTDKGWTVLNVQNAKGDQEKITGLIKALREAKGELRGKDKSLFADFGTADKDAYRLVLSDQKGAPLLTLLAGTKKPAFQGAFVRKPNSDSVYLSNFDLFGKIGLFGDPVKDTPKSDYWVSLSLVDADPAQIVKLETIRFKDGKEMAGAGIFRKADPKDATKKRWEFIRTGEPFAIDADKIRRFFNSMREWKAMRTLDPKEKDYGFAKPAWQMKIGLESNKEILITAGGDDAETKGTYIQISGEPVVFLFPSYYHQNFDIDDSKFFVDNPLGADVAKADRLTVHTDVKDYVLKPKEKKTEALVRYFDALKRLNISTLVMDPADQKKVTTPGKYWLEIESTGNQITALDVGEPLSAGVNEYVSKVRTSAQPFLINESTFKVLFTDLDRLTQEPKPKAPSTTPGAPVASLPAGQVPMVNVTSPQKPEILMPPPKPPEAPKTDPKKDKKKKKK